jgi:hypothetical protein
MFFGRRKPEQVQVQGFLRRICDLTSPNLPHVDDARGDSRQNRTIPVFVAPWYAGKPDLEGATAALTRNISDQGLSVTLSKRADLQEVAVGFWLPRLTNDAWFFLGVVRHNIPIGGGFWALGIEITERLSAAQSASLQGLAVELLKLPGESECRHHDLSADGGTAF